MESHSCFFLWKGSETVYEVIDEAFVKETIGRYDELTRQIHNEVVRVCKSLAQRMDEREKDYMIEAAGMPGKPDGFCISAVGRPSDLYEVYERYRELYSYNIETHSLRSYR